MCDIPKMDRIRNEMIGSTTNVAGLRRNVHMYCIYMRKTKPKKSVYSENIPGYITHNKT